ncbi:class I SAM-dependent methyltransferase [Sorangium sp. So ce375]|uniref:methyltransferase regulatory domain-containing protein n=1 Tax=Sorangium sp. So ce375 TaxID=3133306 RepID=UPI003F5B2057
MNPYDDVTYDDLPVPETHPGHLGAIAALFGLRPAPPERCRLLELGCGRGANLIGMAAALPGSAFIGVDASAHQLARGRADAEALRLQNINLHTMDIFDVDERLGAFDYIVCHGVYSWVAPALQEKILWICRALLAREGLAYISYNTLPGWHLRGMLRDVLLREVPATATRTARISAARDMLALLARASGRDGAHALLRDEVQLLERMSDGDLFHEHLAAEHRAFYFRDFARAASKEGLSYVADAHLWTMMPDRLGDAVAQEVAERSRGLIDTEQLLDYLDLRFFRRSLLCHRELQIERKLTWRRLEGLWLRAALAPSEGPDGHREHEASFVLSRGAELTTTSPLLKAALVRLGESYPAGVGFEALCHEVRGLTGADDEELEVLGKNLLGLVARGAVELDAWARPCAAAVAPRPTTTALARLEAAQGRAGCTTLLHERVAVDAFDRALLVRMDGSRSWEVLAAGTAEEIAAGRLTVEVDGKPRQEPAVLQEITEQKLTRLARRGLLLTG